MHGASCRLLCGRPARPRATSSSRPSRSSPIQRHSDRSRAWVPSTMSRVPRKTIDLPLHTNSPPPSQCTTSHHLPPYTRILPQCHMHAEKCVLADVPRGFGLKCTEKREWSVPKKKGGDVQHADQVCRIRGQAFNPVEELSVTTADPAEHEDTTSTTTTAATQTSAPAALQQWRATQRRFWLELQRLQHGTQRTLDQIRDPCPQLPARTPTAILEQLRDRIALDMNALNQSCVESAACRRAPVSVQQTRTKRSAPKRRRRPQRRKRRSEKRACIDRRIIIYGGQG